MHLVLDRLLTLTITTRLCAGGGAEGQVEAISNAVAALTFGKRMEVATKAAWVAADILADLREVNRVRNKLLHFDPQRKRFESVPEIASATAFRKLTGRGHHAYYGLVTELLPLLERASEAEDLP